MRGHVIAVALMGALLAGCQEAADNFDATVANFVVPPSDGGDVDFNAPMFTIPQQPRLAPGHLPDITTCHAFGDTMTCYTD
jgi:hypothetical protein